MKSPMLVLALTTLSSFALTTTATTVRAEMSSDHAASNPPAEVPSPSLYDLDPSSAVPAPTLR